MMTRLVHWLGHKIDLVDGRHILIEDECGYCLYREMRRSEVGSESAVKFLVQLRGRIIDDRGIHALRSCLGSDIRVLGSGG